MTIFIGIKSALFNYIEEVNTPVDDLTPNPTTTVSTYYVSKNGNDSYQSKLYDFTNYHYINNLFLFATTSTVIATFTVLFQPTSTISLQDHVITKDYLILEILDTVKCKYSFWEYVTTTSTAAASGANSIGSWRFVGEENGIFLLLLR